MNDDSLCLSTFKTVAFFSLYRRHNTSVPNPDFENMDADVSEAFMLVSCKDWKVI